MTIKNLWNHQLEFDCNDRLQKTNQGIILGKSCEVYTRFLHVSWIPPTNKCQGCNQKKKQRHFSSQTKRDEDVFFLSRVMDSPHFIMNKEKMVYKVWGGFPLNPWSFGRIRVTHWIFPAKKSFKPPGRFNQIRWHLFLPRLGTVGIQDFVGFCVTETSRLRIFNLSSTQVTKSKST